MKTLITIMLVASTICSANAAEYAFEKIGTSTVATSIKTATNAVFQAKGYTLGPTITGAALFDVHGPAVAEVTGGNVSPSDWGSVTTPTQTQLVRGGMAVWWIDPKVLNGQLIGAVLTFNRASSPTSAEVSSGLANLASLFPDVPKKAVRAGTF